MAPAVLMSAAATAAVVSSFAKTVAGFAGGATTAGTVGWVAAGFRKVPCPACTKMVRVWDFMDHAKDHTYQCPSCQDDVAFSDLQTHAQRHGFRCPACRQEVPLAELGTHVELHSREDKDDERSKDVHYQSRLRELTREYEKRMLKICRAETEFTEAREDAMLLWAHLKTDCYICKLPVCLAEIESHIAQHRIGLKPESVRRDELAEIKGYKGSKAKNSTVTALIKRWGGRQ